MSPRAKGKLSGTAIPTTRNRFVTNGSTNKMRRITEIWPGEIWQRKGSGYYVTIINIYDTAIHYIYNDKDNAMYRDDFIDNYRFHRSPTEQSYL